MLCSTCTRTLRQCF